MLLFRHLGAREYPRDRLRGRVKVKKEPAKTGNEVSIKHEMDTILFYTESLAIEF